LLHPFSGIVQFPPLLVSLGAAGLASCDRPPGLPHAELPEASLEALIIEAPACALLEVLEDPLVQRLNTSSI
jgi:hypothetical protein